MFPIYGPKTIRKIPHLLILPTHYSAIYIGWHSYIFWAQSLPFSTAYISN